MDGLALYGGFDWQNQRWFRAGRTDDDDRLFYYEKKVGVGLQWEIINNCSLDVQSGYGFDRFFLKVKTTTTAETTVSHLAMDYFWEHRSAVASKRAAVNLDISCIFE